MFWLSNEKFFMQHFLHSPMTKKIPPTVQGYINNTNLRSVRKELLYPQDPSWTCLGFPKSSSEPVNRSFFALKLPFLILVIYTFNSWQVVKNLIWLWSKGFSASNFETYLKVAKSVCLQPDIGRRRHWNKWFTRGNSGDNVDIHSFLAFSPVIGSISNSSSTL